MNEMELNPEDKKVVDLLSKLKSSNGAYPSDILAARRQAYLKQVANVGLGIGIGTGLKNAAKTGNGSGAVATTITSKILETALIAAIAVEAGSVAYLYRDKLADLVKTYTHSSNVQEVTPPSDNGSSLIPELIETLESPSATITTPSNTPPVTPSGTPGTELAGVNNNGTDTNINATPKPGGDNGNHYGQTPKPERTQDNNNNSNNGGNNNGGGGSNNNGGGGNKNKP
jgi:hypothetical protein